MAVPRCDRRRRFPLAVALLLAAPAARCRPPISRRPTATAIAEQQLESNRYRVTFSGNSVTPRETVQNYLLYRAAEVTVANGHDYFTVVDQDLERSTAYYGSGFNDFGLGARPPFARAFGPGFGDYTAYPIDSYTAFADIVMADGEKPAGEVNAYDARDVLRQLAPRSSCPETMA